MLGIKYLKLMFFFKKLIFPLLCGSRGGRGGGDEEATEQADTIFVSGLPEMADEDCINQFFSECAEIKSDTNGCPKIHIYKDKMNNNASKGEATVTFQDAQSAQAAITRYNGTYFPGSNNPLQISIAKMKSNLGMGGDRGGFRGGRGGPRGGDRMNPY
uniref:RRM domain-containing protein n=1 Tax=Romanomermis culicivorax TaxID=13658 RepID=A0A915HNR2_ROMCU